MDDFIFLGTIMLFPYHYVPQDWLECDGRVLKIRDLTVLSVLLAGAYPGGDLYSDGGSTFALPNLKGTEPIPGMRYCISIGDKTLYPPRP